MKKMVKKLIASMLVLAMVMGTFPAAALTAFGKPSESTEVAEAKVSDAVLDATAAISAITEKTGEVKMLSKSEIKADGVLSAAYAELKGAGFTEEQTGQIMYYFSEYKRVIRENPDVFGLEAPYFVDKDSDATPIESLLSQVGYSQAMIEAGYLSFDDVFGVVQLFYMAADFGVSFHGQDVKDARDEALSQIKDDMSDVEKVMTINDWLANKSNFDWTSLLELKAPQPTLSQDEQQMYSIMYDQIKGQVYDQVKEQLLASGMDEATADAYAQAQAQSYMEDPTSDGSLNGSQAALQVACGAYSLWTMQVFGPLYLQNAVCIGYSQAFAYLVQNVFADKYKNSDGTWKTSDEVNYDSNGKHDNAAYMVDFVRIQFHDTVSLFGSPAEDFSNFHFWNAIKLDGTWYYVDTCYTDIYVACMLRDRVETEGNMNHVYFLFSHDSCAEMYDGYYDDIDTLYANKANDKTYEKAWFAYAASPVAVKGNYSYYAYDSTDIFDLMSQMDSYNNGNNSRDLKGADDNQWGDYGNMSSWQDAEYKLVRHDNTKRDSDDSFETLVDFNNGQVLDPETNEMVDNEMIKTYYQKMVQDQKMYPSVEITTAMNGNIMYFNLSNNILSYDITTGKVERVMEYNDVMGTRDMTKTLGGLAFTRTTDSSKADIKVTNAPIAGLAIKNGKLIVSIATTYGLISGKDREDLKDPSNYGYTYAETNYNADYRQSEFTDGDEKNDNDEFMWSANIVDTLDMSHVVGSNHSYKDVKVAETCITDEFTESRCTTCGKVEDGSKTPILLTLGEGAVTVPVEITFVDQDDAEAVAPGSISVEVTPDEEGKYIITEEQIKAAVTAPEGYEVVSATPFEGAIKEGEDPIAASTVTVAKKVVEVPDVNYTLTVNVKDSETDETVASVKVPGKAKEGETCTITAETIKNAVEAELKDYTVAEEYTDFTFGDATEASIEIKADRIKADASLVLTINAYDTKALRDDPALATATIEKTAAKEGETYTVTAEEIKAAITKAGIPEGYELVEDSIKAVEGTYEAGENKVTTEVKLEKHTDASLTIKVFVNGEDQSEATPLATTTITKSGPDGTEVTFTAEEIKTAAEGLAIGDYTLDKVTYKDVTAVCGGEAVEATFTATKNLHGHGHTYLKFSEEYYTRVDENDAKSVFNKGTSYVCIDCMHALEAEDYTSENLTERDKEVKASDLSGKMVEKWSWATDLSAASVYLVPEEYKDLQIDCVWENPLVGCARAEAKVEVTHSGTCDKGITHTYTATATTDAGVTYTDVVKVTDEAKDHAYASAWTWSDDSTSAELTLTCMNEPCTSVVKPEVTMTVNDVKATCKADGYIIYTATAEYNGQKYTESKQVATDAALGHDYGDDDICDREGCGYEKLAPTVTLSNKVAVYTGEAIKAPTATVKGDDVQGAVTGKVSYAYYDDMDEDGNVTGKLSGAPKKPGVYYVVASVAKAGDYKAGKSEPATLRINPQETTVSVANADGAVKVSWKAVDYATGYKVMRKAGKDGKWVTLYSNTTKKSINNKKNLTSGTTYYYAVQVLAADDTASEYNEAGLSIRYFAKPTATVSNDAKGIKVSWKKADGANRYLVYRRTSTKNDWKLVTTIKDADATSYTDTGLTNGKKYYYAIKVGYGTYAKNRSVLSASKTAYRLTRPAISSLKNSASKKMTVKWGKNSKATGYKVQYSTSSSFKNAKTVTVKSASTTQKVISGLTKGKKYYVRVRSYKTVSGTTYNSAWSASKNVKISK